MRGFFFNVNHYAMFLAMVLPLAWAAARIGTNAFFRVAGYGACALMLTAVVLSRCRTAYTALLLVGGAALVRRRLSRPASAGHQPRPRLAAVRGALALGLVVLIAVSALAVSFKPMSAAGRILIWKVSFLTALAHPIAGVGYGNFAAVYNTQQGRYFEEGKGTATERLSASADAYAFNDYLEAFMETGVLGLIVLIPLWGLILGAVIAVFRRGNSPPPILAPAQDALLDLGAAGSVLAFMAMAFFYYPSRILPMALLFSGLLGWIAGDAKPVPARTRGSSRRFILAFGAVFFLAAVILFPTLRMRSAAERSWSEAIALTRDGRTADAIAATRAVHPLLGYDAAFADFHAGLLLGAGEAREAAAVLRRAMVSSSNPRLAERLATAYLDLGELDAALKQARAADAVLPWRLTSKALLAEISGRLGHQSEASRYARLAIETPMKIRTAEGEALKAEAFDLWMRFRPRAGDEADPLLDLLGELPSEHRGGVLGALQAMGSRSGPFVEALRAAGPEERICLAFLLANMPDRDVFGLDASYLAENVRLACLARRTIPLAAGIPDAVFLDYVLPYAGADEDRDRWRPDFYERFRDVAGSSPSAEEAVIRLSRETVLQFRLVYADKSAHERLVGPRRTIERGLVSCGEASLILLDACRSVGIPARLAVLPRYRDRPGGHVWIEVWDAGRWRHIVAYDPSLLDKTWLSDLLATMFPEGGRGLIFTPLFRRTGFRAMKGWDCMFTDISENYLK